MLSIEAKVRKAGKSEAKKLRREGSIPAVVYGYEFENINIEVNKHKLMSILRKSRRNDRFTLNIEGEEEPINVFIKHVQKDPVTDEIIHIDFYKLTPNKMVSVEVPIAIKGEAKGVKLGGDLYQARKRVKVLALPEYIPNEITVDVSELDIGDVIHVFDLKLPEHVKIDSSRNFTVVAVVGKTKQEEISEEEEEETIPEE